jgi:hypothetical protein
MMFASLAYAKNAGDLLSKYLDDPKNIDYETLVLGFVEIVSIENDNTPEEGCSVSGILHLKKIEAVGAKLALPMEFAVRFRKYLNADIVGTPCAWNDMDLNKGTKLLGIFNHWEKDWAVHDRGMTNIINNPEKIDAKLIARAQKLFKSKLLPEKKD